MLIGRSRAVLATSSLVLSGALLLAGCAGSDEPTSTESTATSDSSAFPVTVEHAFGETVVPEEPTRVVVVGYTEQDTVLALGVKPIAVTEWYGEQPYATWPWAQEALGDAQPEVLSADDGLQLEKIAALDPDLIIGTNAGLTKETYGQLAGIAPTIAQSDSAPSYFEPWDVQAEKIGTALGKKDEIDELIAGVREKFSTAAAAHPEFAGKNAIFLQNAFYEGKAIAYQDGLSTDFLTELGFAVPSDIDAYVPAGDTGGQASIPLENLSVLNVADVLVWGTETPTDRAELEKEAVYNALQPVQDGRLVFTDGVTAGAIYFTSVLSLPYVIDKLAPAAAEALNGTPATITG